MSGSLLTSALAESFIYTTNLTQNLNALPTSDPGDGSPFWNGQWLSRTYPYRTPPNPSILASLLIAYPTSDPGDGTPYWNLGVFAKGNGVPGVIPPLTIQLLAYANTDTGNGVPWWNGGIFSLGPIANIILFDMSWATTPACLTKTIKSYLFWQYQDDDDLQAFVDSYNAQTQNYVDWFVNINLPIYTGLSGALLDWVAQGVYGIARPTLIEGPTNTFGAYNTLGYGNGVAYNVMRVVGPSQFVTVNDDVFKRIITWHVFKGDGQQFSIAWLKRRVHQFLNGVNGVPIYPLDNTYDVSVSFSGSTITIIVPNTQIGQLFYYAVGNGVLALPFQYTYNIIVSGGLVVDSNFLKFTNPIGPTSGVGLAAGTLWNDGNTVAIVPGYTPSGPAVYYTDALTAVQLLQMSPLYLPTIAPTTGSNQLWNNGGAVCVA